MQLSAELFAQIVNSLNRGGACRIPEGRRAPRVQQRHNIMVARVVDGQEQPPQLVVLRDFSARGLCILFPQRLAIGSQLIARFARSEGGTMALLCSVAHCSEQARNTYSVGIEFVCRIDPGDPASQESAERIRQSILS